MTINNGINCLPIFTNYSYHICSIDLSNFKSVLTLPIYQNFSLIASTSGALLESFTFNCFDKLNGTVNAVFKTNIATNTSFTLQYDSFVSFSQPLDTKLSSLFMYIIIPQKANSGFLSNSSMTLSTGIVATHNELIAGYITYNAPSLDGVYTFDVLITDSGGICFISNLTLSFNVTRYTRNYQSPSSSSGQSNIMVGASIGAAISFVFCLGLYLYWLYRRRQFRKISSDKEHSPFELQIQRTRWETLQSPTPQYLAGLTSKKFLK